jgi:NADPH:quinone reductase-like Zn-dependent oxidoreductase
MNQMKAFTKYKYGGPEVLQLEEVGKPSIKQGHILVKVYANSANPADWHIIRGKPFIARFSFGLFKPNQKIPGADFAGVVTETGAGVSQFKVGDRVFGETLAGGAFAEFACVPEEVCGLMPGGADFSQMASVPVAGLTALQALTTYGKLQKGEHVLIHGASGGVGHFAVQIAKAYGAEVTAVCSSKNAGFVKELGADHVVAYDTENIHEHKGNYDLVVDVNGNLSYNDYKRMGKRGVMVGFTGMRHMVSVLFRKSFSKYPLTQFTAQANSADLKKLATLIAENKLIPQIEKVYGYEEMPAAVRHIESMRTRGKVVMVWDR